MPEHWLRHLHPYTHTHTYKMNANAMEIDEEVVAQPAPAGIWAFEWEGTHFLRDFRAALIRRGYANEDDFFAHLHGDDEVILRDNGVTFHIAYQAVHRSDNNGMYVSSEDWPESPGFGMWF